MKKVIGLVFVLCLVVAVWYWWQYNQKDELGPLHYFPENAQILVASQSAASCFNKFKNQPDFKPLVASQPFKRLESEFFFLKIKLGHHTPIASFFENRKIAGAYLPEEGGQWVWLFQVKDGEDFVSLFQKLAQELRSLKDIRWTERRTEAGSIIDAFWNKDGRKVSVFLWEEGLVLSHSTSAIESFAIRKKENAKNIKLPKVWDVKTNLGLWYKMPNGSFIGGAIQKENNLWVAKTPTLATEPIASAKPNTLGWDWCTSRMLHWEKRADTAFPIASLNNLKGTWAWAEVESSGGNGTQKIYFTAKQGPLIGQVQDLPEGDEKAQWSRLDGDTPFWLLEYENTWAISQKLSVLRQWLADRETGRTLINSPQFGKLGSLLVGNPQQGTGIFPSRWKTHKSGIALADSFPLLGNWPAIAAFHSTNEAGFLVLCPTMFNNLALPKDSIIRQETWSQNLKGQPLLFRNESLSGWDMLISDQEKNAVWFPKNRKPQSLADSLSSFFTHIFSAGKGSQKQYYFLGEKQVMQIEAPALAKIPPKYQLTELPGFSKGVFLPDSKGGRLIFYTQGQGWHQLDANQTITEWIPQAGEKAIGVPVENLMGFEIEGRKILYWVNNQNEIICLDDKGSFLPQFPLPMGRAFPQTFIENEGSLKDSRLFWLTKSGKLFTYNLEGQLKDTIQFIRKDPSETFKLIPDALQRTFIALATDDKQGFRIVGPNTKTWAQFRLPGKMEQWQFTYYAMSADNQAFACFNPQTKQAGIIFLKSEPIQAKWFTATAPLKLLYSEHTRLWQIYLVNETKFQVISIPPPALVQH